MTARMNNGSASKASSPFSAMPAAWVPPLFAVLICGLQITFWENAIEATGEMFDLLIFAFCVRCLVEYRIMFQESWIIRFAFVHGLGMADNWAMVGFFPAFLVAVVWIKGLPAFNPGFMLRVVGCGLLGALASSFVSADGFPFTTENMPGFWTIVHATVAEEKTFSFDFRERWCWCWR